MKQEFLRGLIFVAALYFLLALATVDCHGSLMPSGREDRAKAQLTYI